MWIKATYDLNLPFTRKEPAMLGYTPQTIQNLIQADGILEIDCRDYTWEAVRDMIAIAVTLPRLPYAINLHHLRLSEQDPR